MKKRWLTSSPSSWHHGIFMPNFATHCLFLRRKSLLRSTQDKTWHQKQKTFLVHLYTSCFSHLPMKSCFICVLLFISKALWEEVWVWTWTHMEDNIVHVALGKNLKEYKPILAWAVWALKNSGGKTICVIHVHQPAKMIPMSKLSTFVRFIHVCTSA